MIFMNHFDLLGVPVTYTIDLKKLDHNYFALQVKYHPDRARNDAQKSKFLKLSIKINEAYKILKNDYARASYLLRLQKIDIESESMNYSLPPEVLGQIWDDREALEETQDVGIFLANKIADRKKLLVELSTSFDIANYKKAAILTLRLRYMDNLITAAKEKMA